MINQPTLSALIICYNEIGNIKKAIDAISFADEIIVVDSFSTDGTWEKINSYLRVKAFQNEFKDFADQRNFAIGKASSDWLLFLDADEQIPVPLKVEILEAIKNNDKIVAFNIPRKFIFENKVMHYSGLQTDLALRLFKKGCANYEPKKTVHEKLNVNGKISTLKNFMLHYTYTDYETYKTKTEHYARMKAIELYKDNKKPNWFHTTVKPTYKFLYNYIIRLGFLDGKAGYTICKLNAQGVRHRYIVLRELFASSPKK